MQGKGDKEIIMIFKILDIQFKFLINYISCDFYLLFVK